MKLRHSLQTIVFAFLVSELCAAGSIKGKVSPGKSVVYLESTKPDLVDKTATMDQRGLLFQPHLMVIQTGTTFEFSNSDKVQHNVFWPSISGDKKKGHNLGTWPQGEKRSFRFTEPGIVLILCNVHPEMSAYVIVSPFPHFAETDDAGDYTLPNVPDGPYTIIAWHEGKKSQSKKITDSGNTIVDFTLR